MSIILAAFSSSTLFFFLFIVGFGGYLQQIISGCSRIVINVKFVISSHRTHSSLWAFVVWYLLHPNRKCLPFVTFFPLFIHF